MSHTSIPLAEIISNVIPLYPQPYDWASTVEYMKSDPVEWDIVCELLRVLESGKSFREVVSIKTSGQEPPYVGNGTHRVVAHMLHGSELVGVKYENQDDVGESYMEDDEEDEEDERHSYHLLLTRALFDSRLSEEESDLFFSVLRSFKLSEDVWITAGTMHGSGCELSMLWDIEDADESTMRAINNLAIERLNAYSVPAPTSVMTYIESWSDIR